MASIFQRVPGGTWWIKYYAEGRQVYHSLKTHDERVARKKKREIEGEEAKGELLAPSKTKLPKFLQQYCEYLTTIRTFKSYKNDVSILRIFFGPVCAALELGTTVNKRFKTDAPPPEPEDTLAHVHVHARYLEDITTARIELFITKRMREEGIAAKTANRFRETLHRLFEYAIKNWGYVSQDRRFPNPAANVERRREPARTIRFLQMDQIDEQMGILEDRPNLYVIVATLIYAGLRREECLWLTTKDVDFRRRLIHVRAKTVDDVFWQPKTKRNRVVPISKTLFEILREYEPQERRGPWFFPSPRGLRWDVDNFSQDLRDINRAHDLEWGCLDYRHTFGSQLAQKGESLYKIAELMGNSPDICRKHYAALMPEQMHDVVEFKREVSKPDDDPAHHATKETVKRHAANEGPRLRLVQ